MTKWNLPPEPIPSWLDPKFEITSENDTTPHDWKTLPKPEVQPIFVLTCFQALRKLGLTHAQALEVLGNAVIETGWGTAFRAWNLGGWKINKSDVDANKAKGLPSWWWRAPGNKEAMDPPWCYYIGFTNIESFFSAWIGKFIPKPGTVGKTHRYQKTGMAFWTGGEWFWELCKAGYKGPVTQKNPDDSITTHHQIIAHSIVFLAQTGLGLKADGAWGPKSVEACKKVQMQNGLPITGQADLALIEKLFS